MLFSKKSQGYFVDLTDHTFAIAKTSSPSAPLVIEEVRTCPADKPEAITALLDEFRPKRKATRSFVKATCGVYPQRRLVRKVTVDPKRIAEPNYLDEVAASQCRITPDEYMLAAVSSTSGAEQIAAAQADKDIIFAGLPNADISQIQKSLVSLGVFPERLEVGTLATLGALVDYLTLTKCATPTLVLEIGEQVTESYVIADGRVATSRQIPQGIEAIIPMVQKELGLKDEDAARRLFYSNTFDFTGMAPSFTKKLIKELQSSIGFYEVQTGQSIGQVICPTLPARLSWIETAIANQLGVTPLKIDYGLWLKERKIVLSTKLPENADTSVLGLISLMISQ